MSQPHLSPVGHRLLSTTTGGQTILGHESQRPSPRYALFNSTASSCTGSEEVRPFGQLNRPYSSGTFIHILDEDSLLHILYLYRSVLLDEDVTNQSRMLQGIWTEERWWYKLAQVCQRWRYLILGSAHHLGLSLVCSHGTPVAEMLELSPPFPLIINYVYYSGSITTKYEEGMMLALNHCDRVRRIRLDILVPDLQEIIVALDNEFPILEWLYIQPPAKENTSLILPKSFRAPHLRHLKLSNFAIPIGSPLLTTVVGLVTLSLENIPPSFYFHPNDLVHWLSQMPQLQTLRITFRSPVPNREVKRELLRRQITTHVTLPNLRWFGFRGASAYLEALLHHMTTPLLAKLQVWFFNQLTFDLPHLLQFLNTAENLRFSSATLTFRKEWCSAIVYPNKEARMYALYIEVGCRHLDWQVASTAQIFNALSSAFAAVEILTLEYRVYGVLSEWRNEADGTQWCDLLRSFGNVKTLRVADGLINQLSRSLQFEDGELPVELLPQLKELSFSYPRKLRDAFATFIAARHIAGRPVTVVRHNPFC